MNVCFENEWFKEKNVRDSLNERSISTQKLLIVIFHGTYLCSKIDFQGFLMVFLYMQLNHHSLFYV